jgi:basic amino acid/polyamine antiporter, APA family
MATNSGSETIFDEKNPSLGRTLGFLPITAAGVGMVIGAGIFVLIGTVHRHSGSLTWLAYLVAGIMAMVTAVAYMEMAKQFPNNSAEYDYVENATGSKKAAVGVSILIVGVFIASMATMALGFGEYTNAFMPSVPVVVSAVAIVAVLAGLNIYGTTETMNFNMGTVSLTVGALVALVLGGMFMDSEGTPTGGQSHTPSVDGLVRGAFIATFAMTGFSTVVKFHEEAKDPSVIPKAIMATVIVTGILYAAIGKMATNTLGGDLSTEQAPLSTIGNIMYGKVGLWVVSAVALMDILNGILIDIFQTSRMVHGICSKYEQAPEFLKSVNASTRTPIGSILAVTVATILMCLLGNIELTAAVTCFGYLLLYATVSGSMVWLWKDQPERFTGKPWVPVVGSVGVVLTLILALLAVRDPSVYGVSDVA